MTGFVDAVQPGLQRLQYFLLLAGMLVANVGLAQTGVASETPEEAQHEVRAGLNLTPAITVLMNANAYVTPFSAWVQHDKGKWRQRATATYLKRDPYTFWATGSNRILVDTSGNLATYRSHNVDRHGVGAQFDFYKVHREGKLSVSYGLGALYFMDWANHGVIETTYDTDSIACQGCLGLPVEFKNVARARSRMHQVGVNFSFGFQADLTKTVGISATVGAPLTFGFGDAVTVDEDLVLSRNRTNTFSMGETLPMLQELSLYFKL